MQLLSEWQEVAFVPNGFEADVLLDGGLYPLLLLILPIIESKFAVGIHFREELEIFGQGSPNYCHHYPFFLRPPDQIFTSFLRALGVDSMNFSIAEPNLYLLIIHNWPIDNYLILDVLSINL